MKMKHIGRAALVLVAVGLTVAALLSIGFLSFVGFYRIYPILALATASIFFAVSVEAVVIHQNIVNGFQKIFSKNYFQLHLTEAYLNKLVENNPNSKFLQAYKAQRDYVKKLTHKTYVSKEDQKKKKKEVKRLERMILHAKRYLSDPGNANSLFENEFEELFTEEARKAFSSNYRRKMIWCRLAYPLIIIAAISCGFVTHTAISAGFVLMLPVLVSYIPSIAAYGITVATLAPVVLGISVVAAMAFCLLTYNTTMNMIINDSLKKMIFRISDEIKEGSVPYGILALGLMFFGVMLALATAGTWWHAVAPALVLINTTYPLVLSRLTMLSVGIYALAQLAFTLENTHETLQTLDKVSPTKSLKKLWKKLCKCNPPLVIAVLIRALLEPLVILGHFVAIGAVTDDFGNKYFSGFVGFVCELAEELHFFVSDHDCKNDLGHNHQHSKILGTAFKVLLSPLLFLGVLWDVGFKSKSFGDALRQNFGVAPKKVKPIGEPVPDEWTHQEIVMRLNKKAKHYEDRDTSHKHDFFKNMSETVSQLKPSADLKNSMTFRELVESNQSEAPEKDGNCNYAHYLSVHSGIMHGKNPTGAERYMEKLNRDYGEFRFEIVV